MALPCLVAYHGLTSRCVRTSEPVTDAGAKSNVPVEVVGRGGIENVKVLLFTKVPLEISNKL